MPLNIYDYSPYIDEQGEISLLNRIQGMIRYGSDWYSEMQAQQKIITRLQKFLSDRYTLIRNFTLPDEEVPIPLMLIGPQGILVMYATNVAGIFEAREKEWLEMDNRSNKFVPTQPNLVLRTVLFARAVKNFLDKKGFAVPEPEPVIIFTHPGADVSTASPAARIVLSDALNRFVTAIQATPAVLDPTEKRTIIELFRKVQTVTTTEPKSGASLLDKLNFSTTQWIVLGGMLSLFAIIILILLALLLANS